jgi:hypothetical protein
VITTLATVLLGVGVAVVALGGIIFATVLREATR